MKRFLILALGLVLMPLVFGACSVNFDGIDDFRAEKVQSMDFSTSNMDKVVVNTENGRVESNVWNKDSISVMFKKWATGGFDGNAEDNVNNIEINVIEDRNSGVLDIEVDFPRHFGTNYGCDIYINLPADLHLDLKTSNGAMQVTGSTNGFKCDTSNGEIVIEDTEGYADLRTSNGKISAINHYGDIYGKTSNGAIDAGVVLSDRGECILKTSNGKIKLAIPQTTSAMIEADTSNGKIEIDDLNVRTIEMNKNKTSFVGRIGSGRGSIDLETSNGKITISRFFESEY